ncbi:hypothetical protein BsIDN1_65260 [Bacillus safensis]|uniref:Fructose-bisphosphate aldolase n=1 Tax=Bacillus safensis TaxID=561879 RepID=A0A5S9MII5_BACIA|nr:hypothetical protein BsIDN1_65260 [Bacillus safensis]
MEMIESSHSVADLSNNWYPRKEEESDLTLKVYIWREILVMLGWRAFFSKQISYIGRIFHHAFSFNDRNVERRKGKKGYAVGQFNLNNLEFTQAILQAAEEEKSPVILGVSEGAGRYMGGFKTVVAMVKALIEEYNVTVPVAIHLDHGSSFESCAKSDSCRIYFCHDRCFSPPIR